MEATSNAPKNITRAIAIGTLIHRGWSQVTAHVLERRGKYGELCTALVGRETITYIRNGHRVVRAMSNV